MERREVLVVGLLAVLIVCGAPAAAGRKAAHRVHYSGYPKSDSSGVTPSSGSSPYSSTPSPDITSPTADISSPTPDISSPTPDITHTSGYGGYGGYGSHSGYGTPKFWKDHPLKVPKFLSLLSTLKKLFGPRLLKLIRHKTVLEALKDQSPEAMPSLAREGAASLINAYTYKDFPLSAMEVITHFNNALSSPDLAAKQALIFQRYNEAV